MYAEAVSCYIYPEASCFTASFIGMQRNVHSLFQLEVFFFSCPRHVFAFHKCIISHLLHNFAGPFMLGALWWQGAWEPPAVGSAEQGRFCGSGSLSWALGQWNSLEKVQQHKGTSWLHSCLVLASSCALSLGFTFEHKPCGAFANRELD